ncbi:MAG: phosphatase PAP2 family protein [Dehalococcoidia bacterium]|nr:phosphatase PAP2 family protein [Dehalococcoidia bacterium]
MEREKTTPVALAALLRQAIRHIGRRDLVEAALVAVAFLLYFLVRGSVIDRPHEAFQNAKDVIDAERWLGIFWEPHMQEWIMGNRVLIQVSNYVYFWLHFPLIIAFGLVLYFADRHKYTVLRDAFLASGAISLIIYGLYPVAPPRLLPELAREFHVVLDGDLRTFVDTMNVHLGYGYQAQSMRPFVNPYAAVPSLHFGWDFLLGGGIIWAFRRYPFIWPLGVALPVTQIFAIAVTANHYFLDALVGMEVALIGLVIAVALQRWAYAPLGRLVSHVPWLARSEEEKARASPV